ncbi:MAG: hypothetical protein Q8M31_07335 [Beijerinckiaceae bacterium]|nr:hypothetical protein [Beijerinckiaceae bacterium]
MTDTNTTRQSTSDNDASNRAKKAASSTAESASNLAGQATGFAGKAASALASEAQNKATGLMHQQMTAGADYVHSISQTAHTAARELEDRAPELARMVHDVADRAEHFADNLRNRSPDEMLDAAWTYARGNPRIFLGGAITIGFLLARFAKSSAERSASARRGQEPFNKASPYASQAGSVKRGATAGPGPTTSTSQSDLSAPVRNTTGGASYAG